MKIRKSLLTLITGAALAIAISGGVSAQSAAAGGTGGTGGTVSHSTTLASTDGQDPWP
jgi:hypothetical protein